MTANPLFGSFGGSGGGRITEDQLHAYAAELNAKRFVRSMGWEYFVSKAENGRCQLDRRDVGDRKLPPLRSVPATPWHERADD
jgi:hypothetical protein